MARRDGSPDSSGPNDWLVDDMYERYVADPSSVGESWRDFFEDYSGRRRISTRSAPPRPPAVGIPGDGGPRAYVEQEPTRDSAAVEGMVKEDHDRTVPTATHLREVPAKLLEANCKILNDHLVRGAGGRVDFTHLIGYAVVRALVHAGILLSPASKPPPGSVGQGPVALGIRTDVATAGGTRRSVVSAVEAADAVDFREFWLSYEDALREARTSDPDIHRSGAAVTLADPGTVGNAESLLPRLMPGEALVVGVGAVDFPAEYQATDPAVLARIGVSKSLMLSATYDDRIVDGLASAELLSGVGRLLLGDENFYDDVFAAMGVPFDPVRWERDVDVQKPLVQVAKQVHVGTLINMYRVRGHLAADLDPLAMKTRRTHPELNPAFHDLTVWDLDRLFYTDGLAGTEETTLEGILDILRGSYCRTIGFEYMHIQEPDQKRWIQDRVEGATWALSSAEQRHLLEQLNAAESFERFLSTKYLGHKRFGIEGAESTIVVVDAVLSAAADSGIDHAVMGMSHRGRLNVLANIVGKSLGDIFREFEGDIDPETIQGSGDVGYHLGSRGKFISPAGNELEVALASNPSHLEAVDPVVEGMARAAQDLSGSRIAGSVLPLILHGDAAFAGQGVVAETLNLSQLRGYRTGGTVHLVVNNQVGFTTTPEEARSSTYPTDVAKMVQAPIFHVNGDDPEACVRVARLAFEFRQAFHRDVVIDMWCYRRFGHNEADEPSYTQPEMYRRIESHRSVRKLYTEKLVNRGDITLEEAERALDDFRRRLQAAFDQTRHLPSPAVGERMGKGLPTEQGSPETGVAREILDRIADVRLTPRDGFHLHPKLARQFETHRQMYRENQVDWSLAEALALGSILMEGIDIRISGQDTRRGTFSQRHAVLVDYENESEHSPLAHLSERQGRFWIYDSLLSEYAALGFEWGYSVVHSDALVCWEAQFGDFANAAQVVIDQFITAAEDKWRQASGLVLLLPHGYEGQGPEHSSARIERFLTLSADHNLRIAIPTTSAQYFHLLRSQVHLAHRTPLVIFTPKSLLRAQQSRSSVDELTHGYFAQVIDDVTVDPESVRRIVLTSGKVSFDAIGARGSGDAGVAVVRVEQLFPWPEGAIAQILGRYPDDAEIVWLQEEPENMGPWRFVRERLRQMTPRSVRHVSRPPSASPATGSHNVHLAEQAELMEAVFADLGSR